MTKGRAKWNGRGLWEWKLAMGNAKMEVGNGKGIGENNIGWRNLGEIIHEKMQQKIIK